MDEAAALAASLRGAMVAAAGFGKTQVIAAAVATHGRGRELILTHTHAGVEALRRRLVKMGTPAGAYSLDTIAGWSLRLASAFPKTAGIEDLQPRDSAAHVRVCAAATRLMKSASIREVLRASYSGIYVDEYQDCSLPQHDLVVGLREVLPCRIVGDPLQGIFGFRDEPTIVWDKHVDPEFDNVPGPTMPWRWSTTNPALGEWLSSVRPVLEAEEQIDLRGAPVTWYQADDPRFAQANQLKACRAAAEKSGESVIAIHAWANQCYAVASRLNGQFSCVEAIDTRDLYECAAQLDASTGLARGAAIIKFASKCMTQTSSELTTIRVALEDGRIPKVRKHSDVLEHLVAIGESNTAAGIPALLDHIHAAVNGVIYRRELLREMKRSIQLFAEGHAANIAEAAWLVRNRARRLGRILPRCAVGTTLLVKGLEFDHAVVLDADALDRRNLYVALTRGSRSLSVVSRERILRPGPSGGEL